MTTIRLGLLFLFGGGRRGLARFALLVAGTAIGVVCLLAAIAIPRVINARQTRAEQRIPVTDRSGAATSRYHSVVKRIGPEPIPMMFVAAGVDAPLPPGVDEFPGPGEALVSPKLLIALKDSADLQVILPYEVVGVIDNEGLTGPDDWYAYVGTERASLPHGGRALGGFGSDINPETDLSDGDKRFVNLSLLGLVGMPLIIYFGITARLSAATRQRRLAALRLVGMTIAQTQRVNGVESVAAALTGCMVGLTIYSAAHASLASIGIAGLQWFPRDSRASVSVVIATLIVVPIAAMLISRIGSYRSVKDAFATRRQMQAPRRSSWRLIPLLLGCGTLSGLVAIGMTKPVAVGLGDEGAVLLVVGLVMTAIGLVAGFEVVPTSVGRGLVRWVDRVPVLLGMRRLEFEPGSATRVVAGLVIVVFATGFANGIQRDAKAINLPLGKNQLYELDGRELAPGDSTRLAGLEGVSASLVTAVSRPVEVATPGGPQKVYVDIKWATCADLRILIGTDFSGCVESGFRVVPIRRKPLTPVPEGTTTLRVPGSSAKLKVPNKTIHLPLREIVALGNLQVVFPPQQLPEDTIPSGGYAIFASENDPNTVREVTLGIARLAPRATVIFRNANFDARHRASIAQGVLHFAVLIGILIGVAAFIVAAIDRIVERRENLVGLAIVGVPTRTQRMAQALQITVPMVTGVVIAVAAGKLAEQATVMLGGAARGWAWKSTIDAVLIGAVSSFVAVLGTVIAVGKKIDVSLIRRQ